MKKIKLTALLLAFIMCVLPLTVGAAGTGTEDFEDIVRLGVYSSKIDPSLDFAEDCVLVFVEKPWDAESPHFNFTVSDFPSLELEKVEFLYCIEFDNEEVYALYLKNPGRREVVQTIVALENDLGVLTDKLTEREIPCYAITPKYDYLDLEGEFTKDINISLDSLGGYWLNEPSIVVEFYPEDGYTIENADIILGELENVEKVEKYISQNMWKVTLKCDGTLKRDMWMSVYEALKQLNKRAGGDIKNAYADTYAIGSTPVEWHNIYDWSSHDWFNAAVWYVKRRDWMTTESFHAPQYITITYIFSETEEKTVTEFKTNCSNVFFYPEMTLSRAMLATILYRIATEDNGNDESAVCTAFSDVDAGKWYTKAIQWAADNDIVEGVGGGKFAPDAPVTRSEFVTMLYRFHDLWKKSPVRYGTSYESFEDDGEVSSWADEAMMWAVGNRLITGRDGNLIAPNAEITRAESAMLFMRYDMYVPKK